MVWLPGLGSSKNTSHSWDGFRRRVRLSILAVALLGICLVLVLTPQRASIEPPSPQLEPGIALVMGSVQDGQQQAIVAADVAAIPTGGGQVIAEGSTQSDGRYILALPKSLPDGLTVEIRRGHYRKASINLTGADLQSLRDGRPLVLPPTIMSRSQGPAFWLTTAIFLVVLGLMATGKRNNTLAALMGVASLFERQLRAQVEFAIRKLLYAIDGSNIDVDAIREYLSDLLLEHIHRPITRPVILERLSRHRIGLRDSAIEKSVRDRIESTCDFYVLPLESELINGRLLPIGGSEPLLNFGDTCESQMVLVVGGSGGGKSATLADLVERLHRGGRPVLPVRFDQIPEGILATTELGRKLLLPESLAVVLAGVAAGKASVLVVDQLDAISITSGRRADMWTLFDQLRREAERPPRMSLVVGCREFDLEHDHRIRTITTEESGFVIVRLRELSAEQVENALQTVGIEPPSVQPALKPILTIPLHLALFLKLPANRVGVHNRDELFDSFWVESERRVDQRLGRKAEWTQTIDRLLNWFSDNQALSARLHILDEFRTDAAAMAPEHFLILSDNRYRFFHESLFDYAFARRFSAKDGNWVDLLLASEQHLSRRAPVRQVLSFLRAHDRPRYLQELEAVLAHAKIRFHIKRLVFQRLSSLSDPLLQEWDVLTRLSSSAPELRNHISGVAAGHPGWFDVLDKRLFFDAALSSGESATEEGAVWMLGLAPILEARRMNCSA